MDTHILLVLSLQRTQTYAVVLALNIIYERPYIQGSGLRLCILIVGLIERFSINPPFIKLSL